MSLQAFIQSIKSRRKCLFILATSLSLVFSTSVWAASLETTRKLNAEVAVAWFELLYDLVKAEQLSPPVASRVYGIAGVTLYEAVVPGFPAHMSLVGQLNELSQVPSPQRGKMYNWRVVANSAMATILRRLFANGSAESLATIDALEEEFASEFEERVTPAVFARSVLHGQMVADAIFAWASTDGFSTFNNCPFTPPSGPGLWVPTPPAFAPNPLQPCWGQLRPFVLSSGSECSPPAPPPYSEDPASQFYLDAKEVYDTVNTLTPEQQTIARFWADNPGMTGTPAGHWIAIIGQLVARRNLSLITAAKAYAQVGIAIADAFITTWNTKYQYNLLRPVTYIRDVIDPDWSSFIVTPPFPEYTSGHSVQSGAAATILSELFVNEAFTDTTHTDHNLVPPLEPRSFNSFIEAANEAAISRLYGGIHFRPAIELGIEQGNCVGQMVVDQINFKKGGK